MKYILTSVTFLSAFILFLQTAQAAQLLYRCEDSSNRTDVFVYDTGAAGYVSLLVKRAGEHDIDLLSYVINDPASENLIYRGKDAQLDIFSGPARFNVSRYHEGLLTLKREMPVTVDCESL